MFFAVAGTTLVLLVAVDTFYTVFSKRGGGWLTNLWTSTIWKGLLIVHRRVTAHALLALAGPALLLSIVVVWYMMLVLGWACIFGSADTSVINSDKQLITNFEDKLFFVGVTLSTLGYGNMVPNGTPWTFWGNATAFSGTVLLTASLSYVLAVLQASIERRQLATMINSIGASTEEFIGRAWRGHNRQVLNSQLLSIATQVDSHAHKHVNYPILRFFHTGQWRNAPAPALLVFSDAVFLASHGMTEEQRPPDSLLHVCAESVANYLDQTSAIDRAVASPACEQEPAGEEETIPDSISLDVLCRLGFDTVDQKGYKDQYRAYLQRRRKLVELTEEDGWDAKSWPPSNGQTTEDSMTWKTLSKKRTGQRLEGVPHPNTGRR